MVSGFQKNLTKHLTDDTQTTGSDQEQNTQNKQGKYLKEYSKKITRDYKEAKAGTMEETKKKMQED